MCVYECLVYEREGREREREREYISKHYKQADNRHGKKKERKEKGIDIMDALIPKCHSTH